MELLFSQLVCFAVTDHADHDGIEEAEALCDPDASSVDIDPFAEATILESGQVYKLQFENPDLSWFSLFNVKFPEDGHYAVLLEHHPTEFEVEGMDIDLLKDHQLNDVEAEFIDGESHSSSESDKWGDTMLGCFFVWLVTLSGLVLIVHTQVWEAIKPYSLMFCSGTLISTAFCLVLYESTHMITDGSDSESSAAGTWAAMILVGFLTSPVLRILLQIFLPSSFNHDKYPMPISMELVSTNDTPVGEKPSPALEGEQVIASYENESVNDQKDKEYSILFAMIMGDFFHNFSDGIFIGSAFLCEPTFAWKMVGITVAHELPQEIGDFSILTAKLGYSVPMALLYNVLSGLSVMLGGIVIMASNVNDKAVGILLAYGAGNYIYVASVHLFEEVQDVNQMVVRLLWFCVGCVAIGLILLDHEHCSSTNDEGGGGHAHHDHRRI